MIAKLLVDGNVFKTLSVEDFKPEIYLALATSLSANSLIESEAVLNIPSPPELRKMVFLYDKRLDERTVEYNFVRLE
jgi:hypothetical protein